MFAGLLIAVLLFLLIRKRGYEREFIRENRKLLHLPAPFCACGLYLSGLYRRISKERGTPGGSEEILLVPDRERKAQEANRFGLMILILLFFSALCVVLSVLFRNPVEILALLRPGFGETRKVELLVSDGEDELPVSVEVHGKAPDAAEYEALFQEEYEQLKETILNGNRSFSEVRSDLYFPEHTERGIRVFYESGNPEVLSSRGLILSEELPEEGVEVLLKLRLQYASFEKSYELALRILKYTEILSEKEALQALIRERDAENPASQTVTLPEEFDGKTLRYTVSGQSPYLLLLLALVLVLYLLIYPKEREKEKLKQREEALLGSYPGLLLRLLMLFQAGLGTRKSLERIQFYLKEEEDQALLSELQILLRNLERGIPEENVYRIFGQRCGLSCYRRLGNYLSRNLRQGLSGAEEFFLQEFERALQENKNHRLKKGEEAATKLVFPMVLMLAVVMAVLVIPAFINL